MINLHSETHLVSNDHSITNKDLGYQSLFALAPINPSLTSRLKISKRAVTKSPLIKMNHQIKMSSTQLALKERKE